MVGSLIAAASLVLILSVLALWIRRVVLDSDGYNTTTAQLLEQPEIQQALATNLVDQLYANVDVATQIQPLLPEQAQPLAAPAAAALRDYADTRSRAPAGLRPRPAGVDQGERGRPRAAGAGAGRRRAAA